MSPRAYCALQCAVPAILSTLDRRGGRNHKDLRTWPSGRIVGDVACIFVAVVFNGKLLQHN